MIRKPLIAAAFLTALSGAAYADCASDAEIAAFVAANNAGEPAKALGAGGSMEDAFCTQAKLVEAMTAHKGPVIGYKAGLTSPPAQKAFNVTAPVRGVLYRDMMLEDGAEVPEKWGARPVFEADLILVVADEGINDAKTTAEVLAHISAIRPFIELPDLAYAQGEPLTGETITAMGVAPKLGVLGAPVPVEDIAAMDKALAEMRVVLKAADGEVLSDVPGAAVLEHPANSALWLISEGIRFKAGDLISVGSFGPLTPPAKGKGGASASYIGLPGDPTVSVVFR